MHCQDHRTYFRIHSTKFFFVLSTGTAYFSPFLKYFSVGNSEMWNLSARALLTVASTAARTPELWDGGEANHARQPQTVLAEQRNPGDSPNPRWTCWDFTGWMDPGLIYPKE